MKSDRMGILYLTDGNRDDLTYASIVALGMNHARPVDIHIVQAGFRTEPPRSVVKCLRSYGHRLATHFLPAQNSGLKGHGHISATAYAKADAIAKIAEIHAQICYVDNDTLAMRPLDLLAAMPTSRVLAAGADLSVSTGFDNPAFFHNCAKHRLEPRYFNSGLLLVDSARWKGSAIAERYESALTVHARHCPFSDGPCVDLDQCAFNIALAGDWETLPVSFNVQKSAFQTKFWDDALIRHYTGPEKFLPARAHRADRRERDVLRKVATACPDIGVKLPSRFSGLAYQVNRLRRRAARNRVAGLIEQHLFS